MQRVHRTTLQWVVVVAAVVSIGWLAFDAVNRLNAPAVAASTLSPSDAAISATTRVDAVRFDHESRMVRARLTASLRGTLGMPQMTSATLLWPDPVDETSRALQLIPSTAFTASSEVSRDGTRTPTADFAADVEVQPTRARSLLLFPFDSYDVPLGFTMCVHTLATAPPVMPTESSALRGNAKRRGAKSTIDEAQVGRPAERREPPCLSPNVSLKTIELVSDAGFEIRTSTKPGDIILFRPRFFRVSSLVLLISASAYFAVILWLPAADEKKYFSDLFGKLLGFLGVLGAIRTFLVPRAINVFPLLIDHISLALFVTVFALTAIRVLNLEKQSKGEEG